MQILTHFNSHALVGLCVITYSVGKSATFSKRIISPFAESLHSKSMLLPATYFNSIGAVFNDFYYVWSGFVSCMCFVLCGGCV